MKKLFLLLCMLVVFAFAVTSCTEDSVKPQEPFQPPQTAEELKNMLQGEWVNIRKISSSNPDDDDPIINESLTASVYFGKDTMLLLREYVDANLQGDSYIVSCYDTLLYKVTGENVIKTYRNNSNEQISGVLFSSADTIQLINFFVLYPNFYPTIGDVIFYRRTNNEK